MQFEMFSKYYLIVPGLFYGMIFVSISQKRKLDTRKIMRLTHSHWSWILGFLSLRPVPCHLNTFGSDGGVNMQVIFNKQFLTDTQVNKPQLSEEFFPCPSSYGPLTIPSSRPNHLFLLFCYFFLFRWDSVLSPLPVEILSIVYSPSQRSLFSQVHFFFI